MQILIFPLLCNLTTTVRTLELGLPVVSFIRKRATASSLDLKKRLCYIV